MHSLPDSSKSDNVSRAPPSVLLFLNHVDPRDSESSWEGLDSQLIGFSALQCFARFSRNAYGITDEAASRPAKTAVYCL